MTRGERVALLLAQSWRPMPPPLPAYDLTDLRTFLLHGGVGPLVAFRARLSEADPLSEALRASEVLCRMQAAFVERVALRLADAGVDALLGKGFAAAQFYARPELRPYTDVDLFIRPDQFERAKLALAEIRPGVLGLDLHRGCSLLGTGFDRLWKRRRTVTLGTARVALFSAEDHLRLIALHAVKHGLGNPKWAVDVAAALEQAEADFDWSLALGCGQSRGWVTSVLSFAGRCLGAFNPSAPRFDGPRWIDRAVLGVWSRPRPPAEVSIWVGLQNRRFLWPALWGRWPTALYAQFALGASPDRPRLGARAEVWLRREVAALARMSRRDKLVAWTRNFSRD